MKLNTFDLFADRFNQEDIFFRQVFKDEYKIERN